MEDRHDGLRQRPHIPWRDEPAGDAVLDEVAAAGDVGGDHRPADGHGLHDRPRQPLAIVGRQDEGGAIGEVGADVVGDAQVLDHALGLPGGDLRAGDGARVLVDGAEQAEARLRVLRLDDARRLDVLDDALVADQSGDQQEARRPRCRRDVGVVVEVEAGAGDLDHSLLRRQDAEADEVGPVVAVQHEDAVADRERGFHRRREDGADQPALALGALGEGIAQALDDGEDPGHAGQAGGEAAHDHRLGRVREDDLDLELAKQRGEAGDVGNVLERVDPGAGEADPLVDGAGPLKAGQIRGAELGGAGEDGVALGDHVLDQPAAKRDDGIAADDGDAAARVRHAGAGLRSQRALREVRCIHGRGLLQSSRPRRPDGPPLRRRSGADRPPG